MRHVELIEMAEIKKTKHGWHLLFSILTAGAWIPIWIGMGIKNSLYNAGLDSPIFGFIFTIVNLVIWFFVIFYFLDNFM